MVTATKQDVLREGIAETLQKSMFDEHPYYDIAYCVLEYLKSQGVVKKAKRELPTRHLHISRTSQESYYLGKQDMLEAGYTATEPLI